MPSTSTGTRRRRAVPRLSAAALAAVLALSGCAGGTEIESGGEEDRFISGDGSATVFETGEREAAPDVSGTTFEGDDLALSDYQGQILVLNVWASWCGPCRAEQPVLDEVHTEYGDLGVDFLGVNIKDNETAARSYTDNKGVLYPSLHDQPGEIPQAFRETVPPRAIPSTLVLDPNGDIAARVIGPTTYGQLTELLDPLVVEFDLGDPEERPRVSEEDGDYGAEDSEGTDETGDEGADEDDG
ncbi:TlpA disulfide reductase family protein [Nocardiopsis sp. JB363]|uniref:TlpA family protein disulfide reductase n=1 Tax=Nocardiopsis sp. JB363 TaxID=1434837 RepID=UPI00097ADAD7|nr:TlpA disulfide reductase family protein [Nocardiopsis sp. JB363]SIO90451.1 Thiol:disulfide oxidoreductase related to ResA [Nocardiopsis sp. JB363]